MRDMLTILWYQMGRSDKVEKLIKRKNPTILSEAYSRLREQDDDGGMEEDFLTIKTRHEMLAQETGSPKEDITNEQSTASEQQRSDRDAYLQKLAQELRQQDNLDKQKHAQRLREKRWEQKRKLREQAKAEVITRAIVEELRVDGTDGRLRWRVDVTNALVVRRPRISSPLLATRQKPKPALSGFRDQPTTKPSQKEPKSAGTNKPTTWDKPTGSESMTWLWRTNRQQLGI